MARKRTASPFSLSFLDIMCCGFGAVVLLVMLLNREMLEVREREQTGARDALRRSSLLHQLAREDLEARAARLAELEDELEALATRERDLRDRLAEESGVTAQARRRAEQSLARLTAAVQTKEATERDRQEAERRREAELARAPSLIGFTGDGRRQYLTGLKLGGDRTLILLDASASMLDETIVNVVRRKLGSEEARRGAPKWRRVVRTVRWLLANMQRGKSFQVYAFDTEARPVVPGTERRWLSASDAAELKAALDGVARIAPINGTSLINAFEVIRSMRPRPDSVVLLTDGLPTQGRGRPSRNTVSADRRGALFDEAIDRLGADVPVNTLLFPLEGDPAAAEAFWRLAIATRGSFITPSRDWP